MQNKLINFKQQRDIGDIISDTFAFFRYNYKSFLLYILKITGPALLIVILSIAYYLYLFLGETGGLSSNSIMFTPTFSGMLIMTLIFMVFAIVVFMNLLYGTILHYIKSYVQNKGEVIYEDVRKGTIKDFWSLLGASILIYMMIIIGFVSCIIPGIYLAVPLSLVFAIIVFKDMGTIDAISYCFSLIKDNWWITFATLLIMTILGYCISMIFSVPLIIYSIAKVIISSQEMSVANPSDIFDWVYVLLSLIARIGGFLVYTITIISGALIYFNLNERKNHTGMYESIEDLGENQN